MILNVNTNKPLVDYTDIHVWSQKSHQIALVHHCMINMHCICTESM